MAFWNITGGSAVTTYDADGNATGTDVDAGTIRFGGNIASTRFQSISMGEQVRFVTIVSGVDGITGAMPQGVFNSGDYVMRKVTTDIAGVSNTALLSGGSNSANKAKAIKQVNRIDARLYKTAIRAGNWNVYSGAFSTSPVSVSTAGGWNIGTSVDNSTNLVTSGTDNAANPSQSVPGELVYHYGSGSRPTTDEYAAKTQW